MTVGQRWRRRRDLTLFAVAGGFSRRLLADVFDLSVSRVGAILRGMERESGHPAIEVTEEARNAWVRQELRKTTGQAHGG